MVVFVEDVGEMVVAAGENVIYNIELQVSNSDI